MLRQNHTMLSSFRFARRVTTLVVLIAMMGALVASESRAASAPAACAKIRPQDQLWLVSCRGLGCDVQNHVGDLKYWRYDRDAGWMKSNLAELLASDDANAVTTVFAHGNRIDWCEAFTRGWQAYRALARCADERPVRLIVWSWPSDAVRGPINDARVKAARTDPAACYLAWFLDHLNPEIRVSLWGHSFGARIVTGALHLLGGGQLIGYRLDPRVHASRQPMNTVLVAAALDNDWLCPGHRHGRAMSQVSSMLLVNNSCDALLKRYHLLYGRHRRHCSAAALGYTGLASWCMSAYDNANISQIDACCAVGSRHAFVGYLESTGMVARMREVLLFEAQSKSSAPLAKARGLDEEKVDHPAIAAVAAE